MAKVILLSVFLHLLMNQAIAQYDQYDEYDDDRNFNQAHSFASNSYVGNGFGSHSIVSSDGNNIIINRRLGPDQKPQDYISVTQPNIRIDGDYFSCNGLICQSGSFKCVVTSEAIADNRENMRTISECFDKDNKSLQRRETSEKNPFPRNEPPYSRFASVDREAGIHIEDSSGRRVFKSGKKLTKEEEEQIIKSVNEETRRINMQIQRQQEQFNKQMQEFQRNMQAQMKQTFGPGFPFGNNFPFYNGFPFPSYNTYHPYTTNNDEYTLNNDNNNANKENNYNNYYY